MNNGRPGNAVSGLVLTKNEEEMLPGCLASLAWADEIVVIDSGSTDKTRDIAEAAGARFLQREFDHFSAQYNYGIENAAGPWILILDADEVLDDSLQDAIRKLLAGATEYDIYNLTRDAYFLGQRLKSSSWSGEKLPRLFRKGSLAYQGMVHSVMDTGGRPIGTVDEGRILHYTYRSLDQFFTKMRLYTSLWARNAHQAGKTASMPYAFATSLWRMIHNYVFRGEVFDGAIGLFLSATAGIYTFEKYMRLWDLNRQDALRRRNGRGRP
ncbi:MAG: glycosyltransferase family 2 protein [Planctomycetaceae bacterium]|nr:glycosyltransferase family 2 protein [Planctomycetaceae bacterium]